MSIITYSIPVFLLLIAVELLVAHARRRAVYRFPDAVADLGCGVVQQLGGLFLTAILLLPYFWVEARYALLDLREDSAFAWVLGFILVDLAYYVWHRMSHRVAFIWATHVPHHQSEDYNLAVALRQAVLSRVTSMPFYLPLAWIGIPPSIYISCVALNTVLQFWIHTELVGRLGPLEWVLNTPSHHRVHHGINPRYIDRNYAGVFIVWDRLFGTFEPESEPVVFGTVAGFRSWNPVWANVEPWVRLFEQCRHARGWERLYLWIAPPEWKPAALGGPVTVPEVDPHRAKWGEPTSPAVRAYVVLWFLVVVLALVALLVTTVSLLVKLVVAALIAATTVIWSGYLERRSWAPTAERARLALLLAIAPVLGASFAPAAGVALAALSLGSLLRVPSVPASASAPTSAPMSAPAPTPTAIAQSAASSPT